MLAEPIRRWIDGALRWLGRCRARADELLTEKLGSALIKRWEHAAFATRIRQIGHGERHCAEPFAFVSGRGARVPGARDAAGTTKLEPGRHRRRPYRRRCQGHGGEALRVRFPCRRSPGLAGGYV